MTIGLLTIELHIEEANSLKDKRQVLKSLLAHLRGEFNISATEVGDHDVWRTATVGIAVVATDGAYANQVLDKVLDHIESNPRADVTHSQIEML